MNLIMLATLPASAAPPWVELYDCTQSNPMEFSDFALRFAVDPRRPVVDVPIAVRLYDLETDGVRAQTTAPVRRNAYDLVDPERDAWHFGQDDVAEYLLLVPHRPLDAEEHEVHVTQVFGGGRAQWVNEFVCVRRS